VSKITEVKNIYSDKKCLFYDIPQNSDIWDGLRSEKVTASECKVLYMGKTTKGYLGLVDEKAYNRAFNEPIESKFSGNYSTMRGHELEPDAVEKYENDTYRECYNGGFYTLGKYLGASPDSNIINVNGGLEAKCYEHAHHEKILKDPDSFLKENWKQIQFQMYVCGFDFVDLIGYHPNYKFLKITVKPDLNFIESIKVEIDLFEKAVEIEVQNKLKLTENYKEEK